MAGGVTSRTLRALRHRNFQLFIGGQMISVIGTWMQSVAQSWLVYRITGSPAMLGLVSFAGQIPIFLMSPVAGYVADRFNRHRLVIATQTASMVLALALAALTLTGRVTVWEIFVAVDAAGRGERVRYSREAVVSGRDGGARRSDERDRAQLFDV